MDGFNQNRVTSWGDNSKMDDTPVRHLVGYLVTMLVARLEKPWVHDAVVEDSHHQFWREER